MTSLQDFSHRRAEHLQMMLLELCRALGLTTVSEAHLSLFAKYHDISKVAVSDEILFKPGPLNNEEKEELYRHYETGYRIAQAATGLAPIVDLILKHHEWWNGKEYPLGLKGEEIPAECRILAIADAYEAMTNYRPYGRELSSAETLKELRKLAGIRFDPVITEVFCNMHDDL
ncbi:MAG TPA: HD domain-containing phosphohydrolase [Desulfitobacteriaceae bacterium]|nr:HD domain-containing phosphohydrolase [Desulfitobacteriaceae bacterium]